MCRAAAAYLAAGLTAMHDDVALARVDLDAYGLKRAAARGGSVPRVNIKVKRPKAEGAMVARAVAKRLDLASAKRADKALIVFGKAFLFHKKAPQNFRYRKG